MLVPYWRVRSFLSRYYKLDKKSNPKFSLRYAIYRLRIYQADLILSRNERKMTKRECLICGEIVQKYSLVSEHLEKYKADSNILYEVIYADWGSNRFSKILIQILASQLTYSTDLASLARFVCNSLQIVKMMLAFVQ